LFRGDHSQSWQAVALYASEVLMERGVRIEVQIAEHGPDAGLHVARMLKDRIPAIFDFRDPIDRDLSRASKIIFNTFIFSRFKFAKGIVNVNEFWTALDAQRFGKPSIAVANGFDPEEFREEEAVTISESFTIGWFGNIQSGQNIAPFLEALKILDSQVRLRFLFRGSNALIFKSQIADEIGDNIILDFEEQVPRKEALRLMCLCDVLLLLSLVNNKVFYLSKGLVPGKTFEYFATLKPILLVPGDQGILSELISRNGFGKIGEHSIQIAAYLEEAYHQKMSNKPVWGIQYDKVAINQYSRESQTGKLAEFLDNLM
jgi:glycosyltransferase involved in cell wall biosynthesis